MGSGDYEAGLQTAILGVADESWNVDDRGNLYCRSRREWLAGSRCTCDDFQDHAEYSDTVRKGAGHVQMDQCRLQRTNFSKRSVWLRFAELSDRPISLVCRVPVTAPNQRRTHQFTLPRRINSEFTAFRGGKDLCSHPSTRE